MTLVKIQQEASTTAQNWPQVDRRRAGRPDAVNPELIPLLRGGLSATPDLDQAYGDPDQLRAARGLAIGVVLSCALWVGLVYVACLIVP